MFTLPTSIRYFPRRFHVYSVALLVYLSLKFTQLANKALRRDDEAREAAWSASNTRAAKAVLRMSSARRGLWIKCCQYIAARSDALPEEYSIVLSKSLDSCPPTAPKLVLQTVRDELRKTENAGELEQIFDQFDPASPIASASIAQVHTAVLRSTGQKVVLKVQHPGIRPMLLQDLYDLKTLLTWVAGAEPKYDMRPVMDAWINMVPLETNFLNEMQNLQEIKKALANCPPHLTTVSYVPKPIPELTSDKLFVMEYIDGCKVNDLVSLDKYEVDREKLVTEISKSFGNQLFVSSVFSGDPHPGNFLVHKLEQHGEPVLLDFGICVKVDDKMRTGFAKLILSAVNNDSYSLIQSLGELGVHFNRADPVASLDIIKYLFRTTAPKEESYEERIQFSKNMKDREKEIEKNENDMAIDKTFTAEPSKLGGKDEKKSSRAPIDSYPGDLIFLFRALGMLRGLASSLSVSHSYLDVLEPYARYVMENSCPEKKRLKEAVYRPIVANGFSASRAAKALEMVFQKLYEKEMMIGMQVAVYRKGKLVLDMASGRMGMYDLRPMQPDTVINSFSTTKGLSSILLASIQDEYGFEYDDLVSKYWPEYGVNGKESTTIGHILSHSAGLADALPEDMAMVRLRDDWQGIIKHLEQAKPAHEPGKETEYHALTYGWLIAGLLTKITGKTYQKHLIELTEKLGIERECFCGTIPADMLHDEQDSRIATLNSYFFKDLDDGPVGKLIKKANAKAKSESESGSKTQTALTMEDKVADVGDVEGRTEKALKELDFPIPGISKAPAYILDLNFFNHPVIRAGFVPSANGHFSARAIAKVYGAVANDGLVEGTRILAVGRAKKMQQKLYHGYLRSHRSWGAGLALFDTIDSNDEVLEIEGMGFGGIGGSIALAVPSENFAIAVTLNKLNALSVSAAIVVAVVFKMFGVPMPVWYKKFSDKVIKTYRDNSAHDFGDEASIIETFLGGGSSETDIMKVLTG